MTAPTRCIRCRERPALGLVCDPCLIAGRESGPRAMSPPAPARAVEKSHTAPAIRERLTEFRVTLPFAALVSDNARSGAGWWTTEDYRKARDNIRALATAAGGGRAPMLGPVAVRALVYFPDARERDVGNYIKCAHDGLAGVAYEKDRQIRDVHWTAAGLDREHPRAEITVRAIEGAYIGGTDDGREHG